MEKKRIALLLSVILCLLGSPHPAALKTPADILDRSDNLAGADINGDGVRDDVEAWVSSSGDTDAQMRALRALHKVMTAAMLADTSDKIELRRVTNGMNNTVNCIWDVYPPDKADRKIADVRKLTFNTQKRFMAYTAYNVAVAGTVVKIPTINTCDIPF